MSLHPLTLSILLVLTTSLSAQSQIDRVREALSQVRVSLSEAVGTAEKVTSGKAVAAMLEAEDNELVYEVVIASSNGTLLEVEVDARTGQIVEVEPFDGDDEEGDDDDEGEDDDDAGENDDDGEDDDDAGESDDDGEDDDDAGESDDDGEDDDDAGASRGSAGNRGETPSRVKLALRAAAIPMSTAIATAEERTGGKAVFCELELEGTQVTYDVLILPQEGKGMLEVEVDARTGKVLEIEIEELGDDDDDDDGGMDDDDDDDDDSGF